MEKSTIAPLEKIVPTPMTIGEDRNKDRFKTWMLCGISKLSFCDYREIKLMKNCLFCQSVCINLPFPPSRLSWIPPHGTWTSLQCFHTWSATGLFFWKGKLRFLTIVNFHSRFVAPSGKPIKCKLKTLLRGCKQYQIFSKTNGWFCSSQQWHPRRLDCGCLSNS